MLLPCFNHGATIPLERFYYAFTMLQPWRNYTFRTLLLCFYYASTMAQLYLKAGAQGSSAAFEYKKIARFRQTIFLYNQL